MRKLILLLVVFCSTKSFAQQNDSTFSIGRNSCNCIFREETTEREAKMIFVKTQKAPSFPGGSNAWDEFLKANLSTLFSGYKEEFIVEFVIQAEGHLTDIKSRNSISNDKFQEAKRILLLSGKWCPGVIKGRCLRTYHQIGFKF
jgi:hypothetical protein